jgi:YbgC/YbaW family acyl-CoA thioester hydrolase
VPSETAQIRIRHRVEWVDTDAAGIYHWSTAGRFLEAAEAALHNALGTSDELFGFMPRLSVSFDFHKPVRFNDEVWVDLEVQSVGRSSLTYSLSVTNLDDEPVASGQLVTCFVDETYSHSRPWPEHVKERLLTAGAQTQLAR